MIDQLLQQFLGSAQGNAALQTLRQQHGLDDATAQTSLQAASEGTMQALQQSGGNPSNPLESILGMAGGGGAGNAITGALSGMLGGGGLSGAVQGGLSGLVAGRVADMIASRTGMNPQMASAVAASLAPHLLNFIRERGGAQGQNVPQQQNVAQGQAPMGNVMTPMGAPQYGAPTPPKDPSAAQKAPPGASVDADIPPPWKRVL